MAINTITYSDKTAINVNADIPDINKVKADDMNEIKQVVNDNATAMGDASTLKTNTTTDIVAGVNSIMDAEVYSTTEVKTNKVWIDGKPIYRKCFSFLNKTLSTGANQLPGTSMSGADTITFSYIISNVISSGDWSPFPKAHYSSFVYQVGYYYSGSSDVWVLEVGSSYLYECFRVISR